MTLSVRRRGGRSMIPGSGRLAAEGQRRQRLRAEVERQQLEHRERKGDRSAAESAKTRNGTTSGVAWAKM